MTFVDMQLLSCVELDRRTVQVTVLEQHSVQRWFRTVVSECAKTYTLNIGVGRWLDGTRYVLKPDPRHFRLMELWASWIAERKLDRFVEVNGEPVRYALPPVPVLPVARRAPRRLDS